MRNGIRVIRNGKSDGISGTQGYAKRTLERLIDMEGNALTHMEIRNGMIGLKGKRKGNQQIRIGRKGNTAQHFMKYETKQEPLK